MRAGFDIAIGLIGRERSRQLKVEGWTAEHDDEWTAGQLLKAARCYAARAGLFSPVPTSWPWQLYWWKPGGVVRDLTRAGALAVAEIDRLSRREDRIPNTSTWAEAEKLLLRQQAELTAGWLAAIVTMLADFVADNRIPHSLRVRPGGEL